MELEHFSHPEHPLSLTKETRLDETGNGVVCYGCHTPISDTHDANSSFYECATCKFYLHKQCAEAPEDIIYSKHSKHLLTLYSEQPYAKSSTCICNVCQRSDWEWFTYDCSKCKFNVDIICALKDMDMICDVNEDRSFKHAGHPHSLTLQQRPVLLHCDACDTKKEDYSYSCSECHFWIHKKCALLPSTMKFSHHNHDLELAYSFPEWYKKYLYDCIICRRGIDDTDWIYYCGLCRYFAHLNCAITFITTPEPAIQSDDEDYEKFPINGDRLAYLISEFVKKNSGDCNGEEKEEKIQHWDHDDHPLILWDDQSNNGDSVYDEMRCDACMQPITSPFYHCSECSYFIHRHCAQLPLELQHEAHLDHQLKLLGWIKRGELFCCQFCMMFSSGFSYYCEICNIFIGIGCITFPSKILHNCHRHPLVMTSKVSECQCQGCKTGFSGFGYECETCDYTLDYKCATRYPHTYTHDYDEHPIYLTYPPIENPSDFLCEICEDDIYPLIWMYCCKLCSFYFHVDCLHDRYLTVEFGWTYEEDNAHPHPLTYIRNGGKNSPCPCAVCGEDNSDFPLFRCNECDFTICPTCTYQPKP